MQHQRVRLRSLCLSQLRSAAQRSRISNQRNWTQMGWHCATRTATQSWRIVWIPCMCTLAVTCVWVYVTSWKWSVRPEIPAINPAIPSTAGSTKPSKLEVPAKELPIAPFPAQVAPAYAARIVKTTAFSCKRLVPHSSMIRTISTALSQSASPCAPIFLCLMPGSTPIFSQGTTLIADFIT